MSKVNTVLWKDLKFKYSPTDNYHGTCYYGALKLLLGKEFEDLYKDEFLGELISNQSTHMNSVNPFSKWVHGRKDYRFGEIDESLHDEEGVLWFSSEDDKDSHIVYFKDGEYYDDYMSLSVIKNPKPLLIVIKRPENG